MSYVGNNQSRLAMIGMAFYHKFNSKILDFSEIKAFQEVCNIYDIKVEEALKFIKSMKPGM